MEGFDPVGGFPFGFFGLADRYASTSKALASKKAKKQNQRRVTYLLGQKPFVPYTRWAVVFEGFRSLVVASVMMYTSREGVK